MILVDRRIGSNDLLEPLRKMGLEVELVELPFADIAFEGKGVAGVTLDIGIELKKLPDLIHSLRSGRLSGHQLPGLTNAFDYRWLLIEGRWQPDAKGQVTVPRRHTWASPPGRMSAAELTKQVLSLELCGGLHVRYTNTRLDTLHFIASCYRWFVDKPFDRHSSHLTTHTAHGFVPISDYRAVVQRFPGIGLRTSLAVEQHFEANLIRTVTASVDEWAGIETVDAQGKRRKLGMSSAGKVVRFCRGQQ